PEAFHLVAVHLLGAGPSLGAAEHDHRPAGPGGLAARPRLLLDAPALTPPVFHGGSRLPVHERGIVALDEVWRPAVAAEQALQLLVADARDTGGVVGLGHVSSA